VTEPLTSLFVAKYDINYRKSLHAWKGYMNEDTTPITSDVLEPSEPEDKQITAEEKEREKEKERLLRDPRVQATFKYFYDKTSKETFGNKTRSYMKGYLLKETQYHSARTLSPKLFAKIAMNAREYLEDTGWGIETLLELNKQKAATTNNARYLDMLYEMGEYKKAATINQTNNQFNIMNVNKTDSDDFDKKFNDFVDSLWGTFTIL